MPASPVGHSEWKSEQELGPTLCIRLYFYAAIVQLQNPVGHGQTNAAAPGFGGEIEIEYLLANLVGNAGSLVCNAQYREFALLLEDDTQCPAFGHRLGAILNHVQRSLLD